MSQAAFSISVPFLVYKMVELRNQSRDTYPCITRKSINLLDFPVWTLLFFADIMRHFAA